MKSIAEKTTKIRVLIDNDNLQYMNSLAIGISEFINNYISLLKSKEEPYEDLFKKIQDTINKH